MSRIDANQIIEPQEFNTIISKLRDFFLSKGYVETFPQPRLSILAACEDPSTVRSFNFGGSIWPLPQTGQMWLERDLMVNQEDIDGVFCITASYRDEPNPVPGRHNLSFPMFEFEHKGDYDDLIITLNDLSVHLGLMQQGDLVIKDYNELCQTYNTEYLTATHEEMMHKDFGDVVAITHFPERTSPFFNMNFSHIENNGDRVYEKCDFIICGIETFGSAARSCNEQDMREAFYTISDGMYAKLLFNEFTQERVEKELHEFLSLPMIPRFGCGIGLTRLLKAMKQKKLI